MRNSKYWDDFDRRVDETVAAVSLNTIPIVRRVACFITNRCNFSCSYCNHQQTKKTMTEETFTRILEKYGNSAIIHITGGEPSVVPWLYDYLRDKGDEYRFHLNTNAYIKPPSESVKRLKVSLDSHDSSYWNSLVGRDAWEQVVHNIKEATYDTIVSITYTLTKQNYNKAVDFAKFCREEFRGLYAIFFSVYKGTDPEFVLSDKEADEFFNVVFPELFEVLDEESKNLIMETIDEKSRLMRGTRFQQNCNGGICYLSMSERVFSPEGDEYTCSHLYRDGVYMRLPLRHLKCSYGCNRRLVAFNEEVERRLDRGER